MNILLMASSNYQVVVLDKPYWSTLILEFIHCWIFELSQSVNFFFLLTLIQMLLKFFPRLRI